MAANDTAIVNLAIQKIGEDLVIDLGSQVKAAVQATAAYPLIRDEVLSSYIWRSQMRRAVLAPLVDKPVFGFQYQYLQPSGMSQIYSIDDDVYAVRELEGDKILTDVGPVLNLRYTVLDTDSSKYEPLLVSALATRLAIQLAMPLAQDANLTDRLWREYRNLATMGAMVSARQSKNNDFPATSWVDVRR